MLRAPLPPAAAAVAVVVRVAPVVVPSLVQVRVAEGADATAAPPAEDKKSMLMALGVPEEVADAAVASDGDAFKDGASRVSMFYSLKVNDDAKAEWKDHYLNYTKGAKASKGHVNVSHSYNEETREVICIETITG